MRPREFESTVVAVEPIMGDTSLVSCTVPDQMARLVRAGHFLHILCRAEGGYDPLLRRPYSIFRSDPAEGTVSILVKPFGRGSAWLARRPLGASLDVLGPLGNSFTIAPRATNLLMVAGGVGAAPLVMLTDEAVARGLNVTFLLGAASAESLLPASSLPTAVEYVVATDDGSSGHHGVVTDLVASYVPWADQIFSCGPEAMFRSLRTTLGPLRIGGKPTVEISIERAMACGLGTCLGCVIETRRGVVASCTGGPVYDMDEVVW